MAAYLVAVSGKLIIKYHVLIEIIFKLKQQQVAGCRLIAINPHNLFELDLAGP